MPLLKKTQITSTFITSHPYICLTWLVKVFAGAHLFWGVSGFWGAQLPSFPAIKQLSAALIALAVVLSAVLVLLVALVASVVRVAWIAPVAFLFGWLGLHQ